MVDLFKTNIKLAEKLSRAYNPRGGLKREDISQEALTALWKATKSFNPEKSKFSTYARKCISNHLSKVVKKKIAKPLPYRNLEETTEYELPDKIDFTKALERFPVRHQAMFKLVALGYTYKEVASLFQCSHQNVGNMIDRMRKKLRREIL